MMEQPTDLVVIERIRGGDGSAFELLVDRYRDSLVNYLTHLCRSRDRAEEFAQEAFVRLYETIPRYRERDRLAPYLFRIATNLVRSDYRRLTRWRLLSPLLDLARESHESPQSDMIRDEIRSKVAAAVQALPLRYREPLVLAEIEEWDIRSIASALGCAEGTIKSRLARARVRLRRSLSAYWIGGVDERGEDERNPSLAAARKGI